MPILLKGCITMSLINSIRRSISPFLEGIARNFDFAGAFDEVISSPDIRENQVQNDWKAVASDYQHSVGVIDKELNGKNEKIKK
jgi:hypothetical protein